MDIGPSNRKPCRAQRDFGPGKQKALSNSTRHWTWYNRKPCRTQLDIGPGTTESLVELNSTLDLVQRKAMSNSTGHWTWYNGKPCRTQMDIGPGTTESHVELNWTLDCNRPAHLIHSVVFAWNLLYRTKIVECCEINKELLRWFFFLRNLKYLLSDLVHDIRS